MALKGTLKDFGIADILQLIGQQQKTGHLVLTSKGDAVTVSFQEGNIVRAESSSRTRKDLIGSMLLNAELISEAQLEMALETQKRTLQRLGDVLVTQGFIDAERFKEVVQLQTSETLFRLFTWHSGSYEFEQREVEVDPSVTPLRAESVLMEGFRRVDEWPVVRKRITSLQMTFEKRKELPPARGAHDEFDLALDDAFAEPDARKKEGGKGEFQSVGEKERLCFGLAQPGRTVQRVIELSCLGEFETAKALCNLVNLDYLQAVAPTSRGGEDFESDSRTSALLGVLGRIAVTMVVVGALLFIATRIDLGAVHVGTTGTTYTDPAAQRFVGKQQLSRIAAALEVFRLENGALPNALSELVNEGLLVADDLRYPWRDDYYYRRTAEGTYVLLPPLR
jgi:Domain of unknown function (DUF4388)